MNNTPLLLAFPEYLSQTQALAATGGWPLAEVKVHRFPDGESRLLLPENLPEHVIFCRSLDHPNDKLVELLLAAAGARELGAQTLTLVAPYLCYMRQDMAFHPGEVVSQRHIGKLLAQSFDRLVTVDAHLHRISSLREAVPLEHAVNLSATVPMGEFLAGRLASPLLVGPDEESEQWVAAIAEHQHLDFMCATKQRFGDRDVQIALPEGNWRGRNVVLVDDVASSGRTLEVAARLLQAQQPASVSVLVTHALFAGDALERLRAVGVGHVWSCDSIAHPSNCVSLAGLLAEALREPSKQIRQVDEIFP